MKLHAALKLLAAQLLSALCAAAPHDSVASESPPLLTDSGRVVPGYVTRYGMN
jgi:hypothetical protein